MANKCAICGAEVNLIKGQKLADGNYICRKNCRSKGMKIFDYVHADLYQVQAHLAQVEKGTKLWEHYFVPKLKEKNKEKKLHNFTGNIYIAADLGLMAVTQVDYKFMLFGKTTRACVYRIADLRDYEYVEEEKKTSNGTEKTTYMRVTFANTEGMYEFHEKIKGTGDYRAFVEYFNKLFKIEKNWRNAKNTWKQQINAVKGVASGMKAVLSGADDAEEKAAAAADALDEAVLGERGELARLADEALAAFKE